MLRTLIRVGLLVAIVVTVQYSIGAVDAIGADGLLSGLHSPLPTGVALTAFEGEISDDNAWVSDCNNCGQADCGECCSGGLIGYADYLNWKPRRQGLDYASFLNPVWLTPTSMESLDLRRNSGLRVGLGYQFASCWDLSWNYTYFHTDDSASVDTVSEPGLLLDSNRSFVDTAFATAWADAKLDYDVNDIEAGRRFSVAHNATMRLFGGFRWAIVDQEFNINHTYRNAQQQTITGSIENPTQMDAYGIRLGTEGRWESNHGLSLFARGAGSVLVGRFDTLQREVDEASGTIIDFSDTYMQAVPVLDVAAGVAWCRGPLEVSGGYELNSWFNMAEVGRGSYDLILDGFFVRLALVR